MHPEIKKFWECGGRTVEVITEPRKGFSNLPLYYIHGDGMILVAAPSIAPHEDRELVYYLDGEWHYEEEMLRLIKLKAFL